MQLENTAKTRLAQGETVLCMGLRNARTADVPLLVRACGFDAFYVDLEHGTATVDVAAQICVAASGLGITPLVRVPEGGYTEAARLLDAGAQGIVFPHVETAADAERIVDSAALPPLGKRGVGGVGPRTFFQKLPAAESAAAVNAATLIVAMLESKAGIDNAESIAAVPGIDVLHIGTNDLAASLGIPGQFDHPELHRCYVVVQAAVEKHSKRMGFGAVAGKPERTAGLIRLGGRFIVAGNDVAYLMAAASADSRSIRSLIPAEAAA